MPDLRRGPSGNADKNQDQSRYGERDSESKEQKLDSSFSAASPEVGNDGATRLRLRKELPTRSLVEENMQRANRKEKSSDKFASRNVRGHFTHYRCSKSTGAVTSCTRKYFASAGYFRATASYIA